MPTSHAATFTDLRRLIEQQHDAAVRALTDPRQDPLDAVAWISAHVAVSERVLYRAVRRARRDRRGIIRTQCAIDRELLHATWQLDRGLTGDVHNAALPTARLLDAVRRHLDEHVTGERRLLDLIGDLDEQMVRRVHDDLTRAIIHAPTRPHPSTPTAAASTAVAFRIGAAIDRIRDALDARHVPVPRRQRAHHAPGRWGYYALGTAAVYPEAAVYPDAKATDVTDSAGRR